MAKQNISTSNLKKCPQFGLESVTWRQVRSQITKINPKLARIIDNLKPGDEYTLILAKYPYGVDIHKAGVACFPTKEGTLTTLDNVQLLNANIATGKSKNKNTAKQLLGYSSSPLGLVLDKAVEVYVETDEGRIIPFKVFRPGIVFGVWEIMETPTVVLRQSWDWSISSGVRTAFIPASISEATSHSKLQRKYKVKSYRPTTVFEHKQIFEEIAKCSEKKWCSQILFFTEKWVQKSRSENPYWASLNAHWAHQAWFQLMQWSNQIVTNFNWEVFISELSLRKIKPKPYLLNTVRHLIDIACGTIPGFVIVDDSENVMPSHTIQKAYIEDYGLKQYTPLLMQPEFLLPKGPAKAVYYSLQYPTLPEKPADLQVFPSVMKMMRELQQLEKFCERSGWMKFLNSIV